MERRAIQQTEVVRAQGMAAWHAGVDKSSATRGKQKISSHTGFSNSWPALLPANTTAA
jgi:hypothetical protein